MNVKQRLERRVEWRRAKCPYGGFTWKDQWPRPVLAEVRDLIRRARAGGYTV